MAKKDTHESRLVPEHRASPWCSKNGFLCAAPQHWSWTMHDTKILILKNWWRRPTMPPRIPLRNTPQTFNLDALVEASMMGDVVALHYLGVLSFTNASAYGEWQPTVLAILKERLKKHHVET